MAGFQFERDLPHQVAAVNAVLSAIADIDVTKPLHAYQNGLINFASHATTLKTNLTALQKAAGITAPQQLADLTQLILDISMETGTGKTYAYTKTMFALNQHYGLAKFIVAVPRVAIKAGAVAFLKSDAAREHFKLDFDNKQIKVYEVQSQKKGKAKKERIPQAILEFCRADTHTNPNVLHVLVINAGMINSPTMDKAFDTTLFDQFNKPFDAIANTQPVLIIDEPHLFKTDNKTFANVRRFAPQFTLRYGATFDNAYENLVYQLGAVDAFNQDLVKGIVAHIERFEGGENTSLKLVGLDNEATFELTQNGKKTRHKLKAKDSLAMVHVEMQALEVDAFNKTKLVLSNGLELRKGDSINPYSYSDTLQNKMMQQTIAKHFEVERALLTQSPRIKPLTLFFIDNIASYRDKTGEMRLFFEQSVKAHIEGLLAKETDVGYKKYLEAAYQDISACHAGYFSADNKDSDEAIEQEAIEILHDKEWLLSLDNPRRFIFSKWTLREGWDNPNIFQICKLRSSGSETSKLQEVGRGLRLPVNEYMSRVKNVAHDLHYYVDFTEADFIEKLVKEINDKSGVDFSAAKLEPALIAEILKHYSAFNHDEEALLARLDDEGIVKRNNDYKEGGFEKLKELFPLAFGAQLKNGKVKKAGNAKSKATIRPGKYNELKALWETLNQKVILEYQFENEQKFDSLFESYLIAHSGAFIKSGSVTQNQRLVIEQDRVTYRNVQTTDEAILPIKMIGYQTFLKELSKACGLSIYTLHAVFAKLLQSGQLDINPYMSMVTLRRIKQGFSDYLMQQVFTQFKVNYLKTSNKIHPTAFTQVDGSVYAEIDSANVGVFDSADSPSDKYLFHHIFYDSVLELEDIKTEIAEVIVYSKIPKNSIRIPLVGGGTYSPDFAYVVKTNNGQTALNLVVEAKGKSELALAVVESQKINHAELFFKQMNSVMKVSFKKQLDDQKMIDLIKQSLTEIH